jgi:tetratricopeptide (TPR) repeat protein
MELGVAELEKGADISGAVECFERACQLNPSLGAAWFHQGFALVKVERFAEAVKCFLRAERCGHHTALAAETRGDALYNLKRFTRARQCYELALRREPANPLVESKLGLALARSGNVQEGLAAIRSALAKRPSAPELHDRLVVTLVWLKQTEEAAVAAEQKLGHVEPPEPSDFLRAASLWAEVKDLARAAAVLQVGLQIHPGHAAMTRSLKDVAEAAEAPQFLTCLQSIT